MNCLPYGQNYESYGSRPAFFGNSGQSIFTGSVRDILPQSWTNTNQCNYWTQVMQAQQSLFQGWQGFCGCQQQQPCQPQQQSCQPQQQNNCGQSSWQQSSCFGNQSSWQQNSNYGGQSSWQQNCMPQFPQCSVPQMPQFCMPQMPQNCCFGSQPFPQMCQPQPPACPPQPEIHIHHHYHNEPAPAPAPAPTPPPLTRTPPALPRPRTSATAVVTVSNSPFVPPRQTVPTPAATRPTNYGAIGGVGGGFSSVGNVSHTSTASAGAADRRGTNGAFFGQVVR